MTQAEIVERIIREHTASINWGLPNGPALLAEAILAALAKPTSRCRGCGAQWPFRDGPNAIECGKCGVA